MKKILLFVLSFIFLLSSCWENNLEKNKTLISENAKVENFIKKWESHIFSKWEWEELKTHIVEVKVHWKEYIKDEYSKIEWKNLVSVRVELENIWKKTTYKTFTKSTLITSDWYEYELKDTIVIQANQNPWEKSVFDIVFDIPEWKEKWAKIILNNKWFWEWDTVWFEL